ncbi:MAG: hypothetical protein L3J78_02815 [Thermoplasmata archaeon]|nr:hypothetical protein [Thermoplasmata archaeon]
MALGMLWMVDVVLALASVGVLVGLLYIYVGNYLVVRSPFSLGLIVFAALFLAENLAAMYFYVAMAGGGEGPSVAMPMLTLNAAELVGFATLFYVSWR